MGKDVIDELFDELERCMTAPGGMNEIEKLLVIRGYARGMLNEKKGKNTPEILDKLRAFEK